MRATSTEDLLRELEGEAADHLLWLKKVHCSLLFHRSDPRPPEMAMHRWAHPPLAPDLDHTAPDSIAALQRLKHCMRVKAQALMAASAAGRAVNTEEYLSFMEAVESYWRAVRRLEEAARRAIAEIDPLTGVLNRRRMMRDLKREWTRMSRTGSSCCLAIVDLDHFKQINDLFGHLVGDRVLRATARFFVRRLRPYDLVYRFGGEEFLFCLPDTDLLTAEKVLDRLRTLMGRLPLTADNGKSLSVTASIGIAQMAPHVALDDTLAGADRAVYAAKRAGRNRVCVATDGVGFPPAPAAHPPARHSA